MDLLYFCKCSKYFPASEKKVQTNVLPSPYPKCTVQSSLPRNLHPIKNSLIPAQVTETVLLNYSVELLQQLESSIT